jgi:hypothetical protein
VCAPRARADPSSPAGDGALTTVDPDARRLALSRVRMRVRSR